MNPGIYFNIAQWSAHCCQVLHWLVTFIRQPWDSQGHTDLMLVITIPRSPLLTLTRSSAQVTLRPETTDHQLSHCGQSYSAQGRGLHLNFSQVLTRDGGQERRTLPESVSVEDVSANQRREHSHVSLCQPIRDQLMPSRVHYCAGCVTIDSRTQFLIW